MTVVDVEGLKLDLKVKRDAARQGGRGFQWRECYSRYDYRRVSQEGQCSHLKRAPSTCNRELGF